LNGTIEGCGHTDGSAAFGARSTLGLFLSFGARSTLGLFLSFFHGALELYNRTKTYFMPGLKRSKSKVVQLHVIKARV